MVMDKRIYSKLYIPEKHKKYDVLPNSRKYNYEIIIHNCLYLEKIKKLTGMNGHEINPYYRYRSYKQFLDEIKNLIDRFPNGTTEDGVYAVMCKLYNSKEEEIDLLSSSVENSKFEGSFTVSTSDNYKVACANYEGGEFKTVEVSVGKDDINTSNPKTYDNIGYYIAILGICVISGIVLMNKKKIS